MAFLCIFVSVHFLMHPTITKRRFNTLSQTGTQIISSDRKQTLMCRQIQETYEQYYDLIVVCLVTVCLYSTQITQKSINTLQQTSLLKCITYFTKSYFTRQQDESRLEYDYIIIEHAQTTLPPSAATFELIALLVGELCYL